MQEGQHVYVQLMVSWPPAIILGILTTWQAKYSALIYFPVAIINSLITMYSKCGNLQKAVEESFHTICFVWLLTKQVFEGYKLSPQSKQTKIWTAIIQAYISHEQQQKAMKLFEEMQTNGIAPDNYTKNTSIGVLFWLYTN